MTDKPFTRIGTPTSDTKRFRMRGKDVLTEVVGVKSFAETFYLLVTGRDLPENHIRTFDACMVILMDHGITPTALVARMVHDSLPDDVQLPMIAGAMMVGNKFAGTMAGAVLLTILQSILTTVNIDESGRQMVYGATLLVLMLFYGRGQRMRG